MRKLLTTFAKDARLSFQGLYFYIEIGIALIFVAVMLFVVPENFNGTQTYFVHLDLSQEEADAVLPSFQDAQESVVLFDSLDDLKQALEKDRSAVGLSISRAGPSYRFELVLQGYESENMRQLIKSTIEGEFLRELPGYVSQSSVTTLEENSVRLSDRKNILPIYLTMNVALMGLFIIAAYIFLDKQEGLIKAYSVTPVYIWQYLASKMMIMLLMGLVTSTVTMLALAGADMNYPLFWLIIISFNLFGSALGLLIASFFDTMVKAMGAMYVGIVVLMLPSVSYFLPSFSPVWIRWMPSYSMLYAFRDLLLGQNTGYVLTQAGLFLVLGFALFAAANLRFKKSLTV